MGARMNSADQESQPASQPAKTIIYSRIYSLARSLREKQYYLQRYCTQHGRVSSVTHRIQVVGIPLAPGCFSIECQEKADSSVHNGCDDRIFPESSGRQ